MIILKIIIFVLSLFLWTTCYADGIVNTYESDARETEITYDNDEMTSEKKVISSTTIIPDEDINSQKEELIKEKIIPDKTDVFKSNDYVKVKNSYQKDSNTTTTPHVVKQVKTPRAPKSVR